MKLGTKVQAAFEDWDPNPAPKPEPKKASAAPVPRAEPKPSTRPWFPWSRWEEYEIDYRGSSDQHDTLAIEFSNVGGLSRKLQVLHNLYMGECWKVTLAPGQTHTVVVPSVGDNYGSFSFNLVE